MLQQKLQQAATKSVTKPFITTVGILTLAFAFSSPQQKL
jgi:hypothetical protein